jgi:two-component system, cell cycle response regulator
MVEDDRTLVDQIPRNERSEVEATAARRTPTLTMSRGPNPGQFAAIEVRSRAIFIGRDATCEFPIDDPSVSRRHARVYMDNSNSNSQVVVQDLDSTNGTLLNGQPIQRAVLSSGDHVHIGDVVLRFEMLDSVDIAYRDGIARKVQDSDLDPLTRLLSRAAMSEHLPGMIERCEARGWPMSAVMMDLDLFKEVNDNYGHPAGDVVLQSAAAIVADAIRREDLAVRFGGEEFLIILPGARRLHARLLAERLRERLSEAKFDGLPSLRVTCSLGVAERVTFEAVDDWLERADKALYRAKDRGRNRSEAAPMPTSKPS